jgi:Ca-activated chloride channel homolog
MGMQALALLSRGKAMKAARLLPSILLAASVVLAPAANSAGMIMIDPIPGMPMPVRPVPITRPGTPTPRPGTAPVLKGSVIWGLRLQSADIKVDINDQVAKTYVTQTFINDSDRDVAGTYLFPLPDDTTFSSFSLHIDGKPVEGKILEAAEARQEYESIVRRMVDPGLLEYADMKTVRARIFPIPAHGTKKVELEYTQLLKAEGGLMKYRFPLKTEGAGEAEEINVRLKLNSKQGLRTIWSPSHTITTDRDGDHAAKIAFLGKDAIPDKDFYLYYSLSDKDLAASMLNHRMTGEDGYYLLTLAPPVESKEVAAKDIVMVADTSGSMNGERMTQNKQALKYLVNALAPEDRFSIVQFNTDVDSFKPTLLPATPENKKLALAYIDDLEARGGTNIGDALKTGATMLDTAADAGTRPGYLILMTDGEPTVGETSIPGLLKTINAKRDIRVFDFGVGYDINTKLLNKIAEEHHGTAHYVEPEESIETSLSNFYQKIKSPMLTDVKIEYDGAVVKDIYPREVNHTFAGSQVLLLGRYKSDGDATVKLTGTLNGVQKAYTFPVKFASAETDHTYLPRLWAMRRIGHLTDVAKDNGDNREVVDEIVALSKKYGIISAYTSFLVTDPAENERLRRRRDITVPEADERSVSWGGRGSGADLGADAVATALPAPNLPPPPLPASAPGFSHSKRLSGPVSGTTLHSAGAGGANFYSAPGAMIPPPPATTLASGATHYTPPVDPSFSAYGDEGLLKDAFTNAPTTGKKAVDAEKAMNKLKQQTVAETKEELAGTKEAGGKTFVLKEGIWTDTAYDAKTSPKIEEITFGTPEYFDLLKTPGISKFLAVGKQVLFVFNGHTYKITFKESA